MPVDIRPITHDDIPGAARCIQEAFADDPYNNWVFDKSKVCRQVSIGLLSVDCVHKARQLGLMFTIDLPSSLIRSVILGRSPCAASGESTMRSSTSPKTRLPRHLTKSLALPCGRHQGQRPAHPIGPPRSTRGPFGFARASSIFALWAAAVCV